MSQPTRTEHLPSSHGTHSRSVTPKDVSSKDATAKDLAERKIASDEQEEHQEELLDDAVDSTFPASDPISVSHATKLDENGKEVNQDPQEPRKEQKRKPH